MSEQQSNPFDPESFTHGGGLWDGKTVTVTSSKAVLEALTFKDGKPVMGTDRDGKPTGEQSIQIGWQIKGIADGADEKERTEVYSAGDKVVPTPDGEGFTMRDGSPLKFHANANIAKFSAALKGAGFPLASLVEGGKQKLGALVGARLVFKAEAKLGRDGKPIKDKKGYDKSLHLPVKFVGYATGAALVSGTSQPIGNVGSGLDAKAEGAVLRALAGGPLTRADLVRALATSLGKDADANAIIGLVVRDDFHKGKPWKYDGTKTSL